MQNKNPMNWKKIIFVSLSSLFLQLLHWLIYQWIAFPAGLLCVTPLLLCAVYHAFQSDTTENRGLGRMSVFISAVCIPMILSILVSLFSFLHNPDLPVFHPMMEQVPSISGYIALFSGRITMTSFYGLVFAGIDVFLLRLQEQHCCQKGEGRI